MFVLMQKILVIAFMDFFNHYQSLLHHGLRSPWISSIFHDLIHLIPLWWWWIVATLALGS
jgi:hypothetical protein